MVEDEAGVEVPHSNGFYCSLLLAPPSSTFTYDEPADLFEEVRDVKRNVMDCRPLAKEMEQLRHELEVPPQPRFADHLPNCRSATAQEISQCDHASMNQVVEVEFPAARGSNADLQSELRPSTKSNQPDERMPIEDQIRNERLWWSQNTRLEARKMGFRLSQELDKSNSALREELRQQLDLERQDRQAFCTDIKKQLSAQRIARADLEHRSEHVLAHAGLIAEASAAREEALRESVLLRQQFERQSVFLARVEAERESQEFKNSAVEAALCDIRLDLLMLRQDVSLQADVRHNVATHQAAINDILHQLASNAEMKRTEGDKELQKISKKLDIVEQHRELLANSVVSLRKEMNDYMNTTTDTQSRIQKQRATETANLQADIKSLRTDVDAVPMQITADLKALRTDVDNLSGPLSSLSGVLDDVRERHTLGMTDLLAHVVGVVSRVESLAENGACVEAAQDLTRAATCLRTASKELLQSSGKGDSNANQQNAGMPVDCMQRAQIELLDRLRTLGISLRTELSTRMDVVRAELENRIDHVQSLSQHKQGLEGEIQDLALKTARDISEIQSAVSELRQAEPSALEQSNTQTQIGEILSQTQIITSSTEKLAQQIASETASWKSGKLQSDARLNNIEKVLEGLTGGENSGCGAPSEWSEINPSEENPDFPALMSARENLASKMNRSLNDDISRTSTALTALMTTTHEFTIRDCSEWTASASDGTDCQTLGWSESPMWGRNLWRSVSSKDEMQSRTTAPSSSSVRKDSSDGLSIYDDELRNLSALENGGNSLHGLGSPKVAMNFQQQQQNSITSLSI